MSRWELQLFTGCGALRTMKVFGEPQKRLSLPLFVRPRRLGGGCNPAPGGCNPEELQWRTFELVAIDNVKMVARYAETLEVKCNA